MPLTADMLAQLTTTGLTPNAVAERLNIGPKEAARLLVAAGAVRGHGRCYRIPSHERTAQAGKRLANPTTSSGSFEHQDLNGRKWETNTVPLQDKRRWL